MMHELKILPKYFEEVLVGRKTFEIRKNDRDYKVGDQVMLREWDPEPGLTEHYTGHFAIYRITYIIDNPDYCKEGFVVFSIKPVEDTFKFDGE